VGGHRHWCDGYIGANSENGSALIQSDTAFTAASKLIGFGTVTFSGSTSMYTICTKESEQEQLPVIHIAYVSFTSDQVYEVKIVGSGLNVQFYSIRVQDAVSVFRFYLMEISKSHTHYNYISGHRRVS
jgi:hypothetical protein